MAKDALTLLHVSDMQFGKHHLFGESGLTERDRHRDSLFARLHEDLRQLAKDPGLVPDLLVVTGDLAEWGMPSEFENARSFLEQLTDALELPRRHVVVLPGNHDVNRRHCKAYFEACEGDETTPVPPYWPKWALFAKLMRDFYGDQEPDKFPSDEPWTLFELPDLRVVVAALNSTMVESHRDEDHYGWVGEDQLRWFAGRLEPYETHGWLRIGAVHHNVLRGAADDDENLRDADDLERILAPHLNLILHGHTHNARLGRLASQIPVASTGSAALAPGQRPAEVPNQYQLIRLTSDTMVRWGRRYERDLKVWAPDHRVALDLSDWRSETREGFVSVHGTFTAADRIQDKEKAAARIQDPYEHGDADDLLTRVGEICALRNPGVSVTRVERTSGGMEYLRIAEHSEGVVRLYPLACVEERVTKAHVDRFIEQVHRRFRARDPFVTSELVCSDSRPLPEELVRDAYRQGVRLRSFVEFQGILDLRGYVERQTAELEADKIYPPELYVPQRYTVLEGRDGNESPEALESAIRWLGSPEGRFVLVLGEFGTGKTFLLHELARRLPEELPDLIPVLIELRALEKAPKVDALVAQHLTAKGEARFDLHAFRYMLSHGRIALLFDGFDELALRVTYDRAAEHLGTLADAAEGQAKIVVTSRTQHFISSKQVTTALSDRVELLAGRQIINLQNFDDRQILAFLESLFDGDRARARRRFELLGDIRDLLGLSKNPRMLSFIAALEDAQLEAARDNEGNITAADLYGLLLDRWLKFEYDRAQPEDDRHTLTLKERRKAVASLALHLWRSSERWVRLSDLTDAVAASIDRLTTGQIDQRHAAHLVASGTLLVRRSDETFAFVHQSVMEWLVADHAAQELQGGEASPDVLGRAEMSELMVDFFIDLAGEDGAGAWAYDVLGQESTADAAVAKANALKLLERLGRVAPSEMRLAGRDLRGAAMRDQDFTEADLHGADFTDARLIRCNLLMADLRGVRAVNARFDDCSLAGANLAGGDFTGASLPGSDLRGATLTGADFTDATLLNADLRGAALDGSTWTRAALIAANVDEELLPLLERSGAVPPDGQAVHPQLLPNGVGGSVAVSADGALFAYAAYHEYVLEAPSVSIWESRTGRALKSLHGHHGSIAAVEFSPFDGALAAAGTSGVTYWDVGSGDVRWRSESRFPIESIAVSPDGRQLAVGGEGGGVLVLSTVDGRVIYALEDVPRTCAVAFSPDGERLAFGGSDSHVRVWEPGSGAPDVLSGHTDWVRGLAFTPTGDRLLSVSDDGTLRVWDRSGHAVATIVCGTEWIMSVTLLRNGTVAAVCSRDGELSVWDVETQSELWRAVTGSTSRSIASFDHGDKVIVATENGAELYDVQDGASRSLARMSQIKAVAAAAAATGDRLVVLGRDQRVRIWSPITGKPLASIEDIPPLTLIVAVDPSGHLVAAAGSDRTVRLWTPDPDDPVQLLEGHSDWVRTLAFSPDGGRLASGGDDRRVIVWDMATGSETLRLETDSWVRSVAFDPGGSSVAAVDDAGVAHVWDAGNGRPTAQLTDGMRPLRAIQYVGEGLVALAGVAGTISLWSMSSHDRATTLGHHDGWILTLAYSAANGLLASGGTDGVIRLWDVATGRQIDALNAGGGAVTSVLWGAENGWLAATHSDGMVRIWDSRTWSLVASLVALSAGWAALLPDGRYKLAGQTTGELWYTAGLSRFEPGELDPYVANLRAIEEDEPLLMPDGSGWSAAPLQSPPDLA